MWLLLAGMLEVGFATALKLAQENPIFYPVFLVCMVLSFEALSKSLKEIPLSTAYAIWTGIGAVGAVLVGAVLFGELLSPLRMVLLGGLIVTLIALKLATPPAAKDGG